MRSFRSKQRLRLRITIRSFRYKKRLRHCIQETYGNSIPSVDQVVRHLRDKYPKYGRQKFQPFTRIVKQIALTLDSSNNNTGKCKIDDDEDMTSHTSVSKILKKVGSSEQSEEFMSAAATSEDVHSLKVEPEFDLTKSTLRNKCSGSNSDDEKPTNVELSNKDVKEVSEFMSGASTSEDVHSLKVEPEFDLTKSIVRNKCSGSNSDDEKPTNVELSNKEVKEVSEFMSGASTSEDVHSFKVEPEYDLTKSIVRNKCSGSNSDDEKPTNVELSNKEVKEVSEFMSAASTSEDVHSLKVEPEFDLLRNKCSGSNSNDEKPTNEEVKEVDLLKGDEGVEATAKMKAQKSSDENGDWPMFKDLGGIDSLLYELKRRVVIPLRCPQLPWGLGAKPMSGILLHGPSGCGKTTLARAIANETRVPFNFISASEIVSPYSGASEKNIRKLFSKAYETVPSIVFIDEIDGIASKEDFQSESDRRIVIQLMTCMDESHRIAKPDAASKNAVTPDGKQGYVLVIGATNRPDALDPALRRRFEREFTLGVPDENGRTNILSVLTRSLKLEGAFDLVKISRSTPGFVAVDLVNLVNEASNLAVDRIIDRTDTEQNEDGWWNAWTPEEMEKDSVTMSDFEVAGKRVQPSSKREGFSSVPNVKWEDVGGLDELREEFYLHIVSRIKCPDEYEENGLDLETGFLLYGPPGCGKTLIAKAIANEAGANFIHIKGPELLDKYIGESELKVRTLFSRARTCAPCVLFFDEVDSLTRKRGKEGETCYEEKVLNQLLLELDGGDERRGVYVIGATNRPEVMDPAVLRPGRFGKRLYVPLPNAYERGLILKSLARTKRLDADVDLIAIGRRCDKFSGADLRALINEANLAAFKEKIKAPTAAVNERTSVSSSKSSLRGIQCRIKSVHIDQALEKISPSISEEQIRFYNRLQMKFNPNHHKH